MIPNILFALCSIGFGVHAWRMHRAGVAYLPYLRRGIERDREPQGFYIAVGSYWFFAACFAIGAVVAR
jgi:hypothetical protein